MSEYFTHTLLNDAEHSERGELTETFIGTKRKRMTHDLIQINKACLFIIWLCVVRNRSFPSRSMSFEIDLYIKRFRNLQSSFGIPNNTCFTFIIVDLLLNGFAMLVILIAHDCRTHVWAQIKMFEIFFVCDFSFGRLSAWNIQNADDVCQKYPDEYFGDESMRIFQNRIFFASWVTSYLICFNREWFTLALFQ